MAFILLFPFLAWLGVHAFTQEGDGALKRFPPQQWEVKAYVDNFDLTDNRTFSQQVLSYDKWWKKGAPILLYLGNEGPIPSFYNYTGAMFEHAQALGAYVVFVEHRFYGNSMPETGSLAHLTVEQALADYAYFISKLRRLLSCADDECPVVTFGGSYGGMLVAWFRQKYPHLTVGGIAASAPIDFYAQTGVQELFWNATMHTFEAFGSPGCPEAFSNSLIKIKELAATADGRLTIEHGLSSCDALANETTAGEKVDMFLRGLLASLAMLDYPEASSFVTPLPANPVLAACNRLQSETDLVAGLRSVVDLYLNATGDFVCYDFIAEIVGRPTLGDFKGPKKQPDMGAWQYQACNELILEPITTDGFGFYPPNDGQLADVAAACQLRYNVTPRPDWLPLSTGRSDLRIGNLLFTDGEKDPWRAGAVRMERVASGLDVVHHVIPGAAHHEDLRFSSVHVRQEVQKAKELARASIQRWISSHRESENLVI